MKRRLAWVLVWLVTLAVIGGAIVLSIVKEYSAVDTITVVGVAVASTTAALALVLTWSGNRASARGTNQMASDISRLAELTETSIVEARSRRPAPTVGFLLDDLPKAMPSIQLVRASPEVEIDVERIVAEQRAQALATMARSRTASKQRSVSPGIARLIAQTEKARFGSILGTLPATEEEVKAFEERVEQFASALRQWLERHLEERRKQWQLVRLNLCFENLGRVPADGARLYLHFPDPFAAVEDGSTHGFEAPPRRPRFVGRNKFAALMPPRDQLGLTGGGPPGYPARPLHRPGDVSSPRYTAGGSVGVEMKVAKIVHGVPVVTSSDEEILLRLGEDGEWSIPWTIRAENLPEPTEGTLTLTAETTPPSRGIVTTLGDLLAREN